MRVVWKFPLSITGGSTVTVHDIPQGARFLHCAEQGGAVALWYEIPDTNAATVARRFELFGTGTGSIPDHLTYVGTSMHYNGMLVLHVYEEPA